MNDDKFLFESKTIISRKGDRGRAGTAVYEE
jgi:hypothetical protein